MAETLQEFLVSVKYGVDAASQNNFLAALKHVAGSVAGVAAEITGLTAGIIALGKVMAETGEKFYFMSQRFGSGVGDIRNAAFAMSQLGQSTEQAAGQMEAFSAWTRSMGPAATSYLRSLGVTARDSVGQMNQLGAALRRMGGTREFATGTDQQRLQYALALRRAQMMGLSEQGMLGLTDPNREANENRAGVIRAAIWGVKTKDEADAAEKRWAETSNKMMNQFRQFGLIFETLKSRFGQSLMEKLLPVLEKFQKLLLDNMPLITSWLDHVAHGLALFTELVGGAIAAFTKLPGAVQAAIGIIASWKTGLSLVTSPVFAFIAALTTLLLLLDDYQHWKKDHTSSAIDWGGIEGAFTTIADSVKPIYDFLKPIYDGAAKWFDDMVGVKGAFEAISIAVGVIALKWGAMWALRATGRGLLSLGRGAAGLAGRGATAAAGAAAEGAGATAAAVSEGVAAFVASSAGIVAIGAAVGVAMGTAHKLLDDYLESKYGLHRMDPTGSQSFGAGGAIVPQSQEQINDFFSRFGQAWDWLTGKKQAPPAGGAPVAPATPGGAQTMPPPVVEEHKQGAKTFWEKTLEFLKEGAAVGNMASAASPTGNMFAGPGAPGFAADPRTLTAAERAVPGGAGAFLAGRAGSSAGVGSGTGLEGIGEGGTGSGGEARGPAVAMLSNYFQSQGWTKAQTAGIIANLQQESGLNPHGKPGDSGLAVGIAQWHPDRQAMFLRQMGKRVQEATLLEQAQFVQWELTHSEAAAGRMLRAARNAHEAAGAVSRYYERPRDTQREMEGRGRAATALEGRLPEYTPLGSDTKGGAGAILRDQAEKRLHQNNSTTIHVAPSPNAQETASRVAEMQGRVHERFTRNAEGMVLA